MSNVPVLQAVRAAEAFRRLHWRRVAGVLVVVAASGAVSQAGVLANDMTLRAIGEIVYVVSAIAAYAALMRLAFIDEHPDDPEFVPGAQGFQWGRPEWRLIGVGLLMGFVFILALAFVVFFCILILVTAGVGAVTADTSPESVMDAVGPGGQALLSALVFGFLVGLLFFSVRISLAPAATMARKHVAVFQTWRLTKGQFWRIFAATVLVGLPALLAGVVLGLVVMIFGNPSAEGGAPQMAMPGALLAGAIPAAVSAFIVLPLTAGLTAFLYRGLRQGPDIEADVREGPRPASYDGAPPPGPDGAARAAPARP